MSTIINGVRLTNVDQLTLEASTSGYTTLFLYATARYPPSSSQLSILDKTPAIVTDRPDTHRHIAGPCAGHDDVYCYRHSK